MLTDGQAREIVRGSIKKVSKNPAKVAEQFSIPGSTLASIGLESDDDLQSLHLAIAADPDVGVPRLGHYIDPNQLAETIKQPISIDKLVGEIVRLAAGKLCSNPQNPHQQRFPYPGNCPECGYPVR